MGRGSSGGSGRASGGGGVDPANIGNMKDMISSRADYQEGADQVLNVARDLNERFGGPGVIDGSFQTASFGGKDSGTLGAYDGNNIIMNQKFMDPETMDAAMKAAADSGWHPSTGNKSGIEAVAAHEFGHHLTDEVGKKMGAKNIDEAATRIVNEARKDTKFRGVVQMANSISRYASTTNAEAIAEAVSDVYCNGKKAAQASKAIVNVIDKYLKM